MSMELRWSIGESSSAHTMCGKVCHDFDHSIFKSGIEAGGVGEMGEFGV